MLRLNTSSPDFEQAFRRLVRERRESGDADISQEAEAVEAVIRRAGCPVASGVADPQLKEAAGVTPERVRSISGLGDLS